MPTLAALAPIANPASTTHAPSAPSPRRYQELPAHPPPRIMPMPKTKPPVRLASQRNGRTGMDSTSPSSSTWTPTIATRSASTYARRIAVSPMRTQLESARVRQNPPRCAQ